MKNFFKSLRNAYLKNKWGKRTYNIDYDSKLKLDLLKDRNIPLLQSDKVEKYGLFKIIREEEKNYYTENILTEHYIWDNLYYFYIDKWELVLEHVIYDYEKKLDHGKERVYNFVPLIRMMYVDVGNDMMFIEDEEGDVYCSIDKLKWFYYHVEPQQRPYSKRIKNLRKYEIISEYQS